MNPKLLPGGFLGVDIFFVISGFLITKIIHRQIIDKSSSFTDFYTRRMKRILPACFTVILTCLVVGYFLLLPSDYKELGKSALSTLVFSSNIFFAMDAGGYFNAKESIPLLHTWSLAVEEQYYFIWPIVLIGLSKLNFTHKALILTLTLVASISFIGATIIALTDGILSQWNYYLLPSRAGELLVGSITALLINNGFQLKKDYLFGIIGLLLILLSFILIDSSSIFPGINALWSCLGVAFIILRKPDNFINRALSIGPMTYTGLISYSLYLWHWPVLSFMRYINPDNQVENQLSLAQLIFAGFLTWLLAHITYSLVECKTRSTKFSFPNTLKYYFIAPSIAILVIAGAIYATKGFSPRFGNNVAEQMIFTPNHMCSRTADIGCTLSEGQRDYRIALVGDSHAQSLEVFFQLFGKDNDFIIEDYATSSCTPGQPDKLINPRVREKCNRSTNTLKAKLDTIDAVILVGRWDNVFFSTFDNSVKKTRGYAKDYYQRLQSEIEYYQSAGVDKIIIVSQAPKYMQDIRKLLLPINGKDYEKDDIFREANKKISTLSRETGIYQLDFSSIFCESDECSPFDTDGNILYYDDDHLNVYGAKWLYKKYRQTELHTKTLDYLLPNETNTL